MARCWLEQTVSSGSVELFQAGTVVGDGNRVCGVWSQEHQPPYAARSHAQVWSAPLVQKGLGGVVC